MAARPKTAPEAPRAPQTDLPAGREEALGESLRAMFDHVAEQPLPEDMLQLVDELERKRSLEEPDED